ncbi:hypothetical protein K439DRAFT_1663709 [Ramaria rubella]|nr:hypothetical protein K439DRAFT_1663709 [Ramaria rubella]
MTRLVLHQRLARWSRLATPRGREIVLEILKSAYPQPLRTQELYERIRKEYPDEKLPAPVPIPPPLRSPKSLAITASGKVKKEKPVPEPVQPPHPDHPIRSLKYLKSIILGELTQRNQVSKVHSMREPTPEELAQKGRRLKGKKKQASNTPMAIINVKGMVDQWGWVLKTPEDLEFQKEERLRIQKAVEGQKQLDPEKLKEEAQKKFAAEWEHLNVRRRRARAGKLEREEKWARLLEGERQAGRKEAVQSVD